MSKEVDEVGHVFVAAQGGVEERVGDSVAGELGESFQDLRRNTLSNGLIGKYPLVNLKLTVNVSGFEKSNFAPDSCSITSGMGMLMLVLSPELFCFRRCRTPLGSSRCEIVPELDSCILNEGISRPSAGGPDSNMMLGSFPCCLYARHSTIAM